MSGIVGLLLLGSTRDDAEMLASISPDMDRVVRLARACLEFNPPHVGTVRLLGSGELPRTTSAYSAAVRTLARYARETVPYEVDQGHAEMERLLYNALAPERNAETAAYCLLALIEAGAGTLLRRQLRLVAVNYNAAAEGAGDLSERAIFRLFAQTTENLPVFHTDAGNKPWLYNIAAALVHAALKTQAYDCIAGLIEQPMFLAALPVSELNLLQESCCKALLSCRTLQRTSPDDTIIFLSDDQAQRIRDLTTRATDVSQTTTELLVTLSSVDQLTRLREAAEEAAPGQGREQFAQQLPDVHVQRSAARLEIATDRRTQLAGAINAVRSRVQEALDSLPPAETMTPLERETEAYIKQLFDRMPLDHPLEPTDTFVDHQKPTTPAAATADRKWPLSRAMTAIQELLVSGRYANQDAWLHIALLLLLYRYYAGIAHPEEYAARKQLSAAREAALARKYEEGESALEELMGRVRAISFAAYLGEDE